MIEFGPLSLRVRELDPILDFYCKDLGLKVVRRDREIVQLGSSTTNTEPLLILKNDPNAGTAPQDAAGLYHFAMLLPDRRSLAAAYLKIGDAGVVFDGYADHQVSEALYLTDPEGNGIEIYADKPRRDWKVDDYGSPQMGTYPLDIDSLLLEVKGKPIDEAKALGERTTIGHMHLRVTEIRRSTDFYHYRLGLNLMNYWDTAAFLSAGGYHHHIGMNTWESSFGSKFTEGRVGLEYFTIRIPTPSLATDLCLRLGGTTQNEPVFQDPDGIKFKIKTI